ncbi:MAG: HAMP domain-containing protein [Devosia sp.]|uniref:methyl-accepting chemotaxis protein n=1 Tax=Devosia sp. TaxID=1871048 RepID=UPI001A034639|nr:methyl-accepting chemotaxis protein [Devosia sp.]MBF0680810.1 HAMP domain-containing protein [Devosia sp.]
MRIRGKLLTIVAVMGLVSALITGMGLHIVREYGQQIERLDNASKRALSGEKLNRLVTAVVMDSRGIYASADTAAAAQFANGIMTNLDNIDAVLEGWRPLLAAADLPGFEAMVARAAEFRTFRTETARLGRDVDPALANEQGNNEENRANRKAFQTEIDAVVTADIERFAGIQDEIAGFQSAMQTMLLLAAGLGIAAGTAGALYMGTRQMSRPIGQLTLAMRDLADGKFETEVPGAARKDEIGEMAAAVQVFKENGIRIANMSAEEQANAMRTAARAKVMEDFQREFDDVVAAAKAGDFSQAISGHFDDDDITRIARNFNAMVESVRHGIDDATVVLSALADTDLSQRMEGNHQGAFLRLKTDMNRVAETLSDVVTRLRATSRGVKSATGEILAGANDLSERTTRQAATIEETSAAIEQLAVTVTENAKRAQDGTATAEAVTSAALQGGAVMKQATEAMDRISTSSSKISNIIGMIDDIAFQTNLLALNASVEAARAGDAGNGFAVVAVEVRRLAQSSAEASSEIKRLIEQSAIEVSGGTRLVGDAAAKLDAMLEAVRTNSALMSDIARESSQQAAAIEEVTVAVRQMDEMTQHNAALVEETNAAIEQTEARANELDKIVEVFRLEDTADWAETASSMRSAPRKPAPAKPAKAARGSYLSQGNAAISADWSEF